MPDIKLTPDQEARLPEIRDEWIAHGLSTDPADRPAAEAAIAKCYEAAQFGVPPIVWVDSPLAGIEEVAELASIKPSEALNLCGYGQHDAPWVAYYAAVREFGLEDEQPDMEGLMQLTKSAGWWWPFDEVCVVAERHSYLERDERGRLHSTQRRAVEFPDGWGLTMWHGIEVPEHVVLEPESLTAEEITNERNAEVKRAMLAQFGEGRYIEEIGADCVQRDDYGELYRAEIAGDPEPLVMVKVWNSTPEPQEIVAEMSSNELGSCRVLDQAETREVYKPYWLRVPPDTQTAREGVAWTFDVEKPELYEPVFES